MLICERTGIDSQQRSTMRSEAETDSRAEVGLQTAFEGQSVIDDKQVEGKCGEPGLVGR